MSERPDFSIVEVILCGFAIAAAASSLIYAGKLWHDEAFFDAMEFFGGAVVFGAAAFDPLNSIADTLTFPLQFFEPSGHATKLTTAASLVGFAIALAGWLLGAYVARTA